MEQPKDFALGSDAPRANVAVCGKFHLFNYVPTLRKRGRLQHFYFSHRRYPEPGLFKEYCRLPVKEYLMQGHLRLLGTHLLGQLSPKYADLWNRSALRRWEPAPLLHFVANGNCLPLVSRAKGDGSRLIGEVVVVHPGFLDQTMQEEADHWRIPFRRIIPLELQRRHEAELDQVDVILAPSRFVEKTYRDKGRKTRVSMIPYAANIERFSPPVRRRTSPERLKVLCVGQIGTRKGQLYLLDAVKRFKSRDVDLTLIGTISDEVKQKIQEYQHVFTHINRISNVELAALHHNFDVFILPSLAEGLAVSICEAMGSGLAVACTAESGGAEIIDHGRTGYILPSRSTDAIEEFLSYCLSNKDAMRGLGDNAAKAAHASINWEDYARRLIDLYDDVHHKQAVS